MTLKPFFISRSAADETERNLIPTTLERNFFSVKRKFSDPREGTAAPATLQMMRVRKVEVHGRRNAERREN